MTADTLKTTRVLELYQDFLSGKLINKQKAAEQYHVNVRSIQRDIDSIRDFLSEQCAKEGIVRKIEYDKKENGYRLVTQEVEQLSKGEVLALCKILLESRAFTKEQVEKQLHAGEQRRLSANRDLFVVFGHCIKGHNLSSPYIKKQDTPHGLPCKSKGRASEDTPPKSYTV